MAILVKSVTIKNEVMVQAKPMSATVEIGDDTVFFMAQIKLGDTLLFECPVEFLDLVAQLFAETHREVLKTKKALASGD